MKTFYPAISDELAASGRRIDGNNLTELLCQLTTKEYLVAHHTRWKDSFANTIETRDEYEEYLSEVQNGHIVHHGWYAIRKSEWAKK